VSDLEAFRTILREELAPLRAQLLAIEGLVRLQPDLSFRIRRRWHTRLFRRYARPRQSHCRMSQ
jgi:hypothetical protein